MSEAKFDSKRRLCPDGACIGVVGDDGRCRVCGRDAGGAKVVAAVGGDASAPTAAAAAAAEVDDDTDADMNDGDDMAAVGADPGAPAFDAGRRLCSDGSCIGLIGPDGRCNVCGTPASEEPRQ
jgi:hypothetical protein